MAVSDLSMERFPLPLHQQALFFDTLKNPKSSSYTYCYACEIKGNLDAPLLEKILCDAITTQSALCTSFIDLLKYPCIRSLSGYAEQKQQCRGEGIYKNAPASL
jgi:hypothetical protein